MKKMLFGLLMVVFLGGCGVQGESLTPHGFQIPTDHVVTAHSAKWVEFEKDGKMSGEYRVIEVEEYEKEMGEYPPQTVVIDTEGLLYSGKQVFLQEGNRVGGVKYYLFDKKQDVVHMFHFDSPAFAPERTLSYVKTMKRLD